MSTTPANLIALALLDSGVIGQGQRASAADTNNAYARLQMMMAQWNRKRWLTYCLVDLPLVSTGAQSYTIGPGGDFDTTRPDRLEDGCFVRQLNTSQPVDYPLSLIQSREAYSRIVMKEMGNFAWSIFYDSQFPTGTLYPWPVPAAGTYELHVLVKQPLNPFTSISQTILLPPEYEAAILYNLQVRLRAAYRLPPDPVIIALAKDALNLIRGANAQIATLTMPRAVMGRGPAYSVYSDT